MRKIFLAAAVAMIGVCLLAVDASPTKAAYSYVPLLDSRDVFPASGEQDAAVLTTPPFIM